MRRSARDSGRELAGRLVDDCLNSVTAIKLAAGELSDPAVTLSGRDRDELLSVISDAADHLTARLRTPPAAG